MMTVCLALMASHLACTTLSVRVTVQRSVYHVEEWVTFHILAVVGAVAVPAGATAMKTDTVKLLQIQVVWPACLVL